MDSEFTAGASRCVVERFRANPEGFLVGAPYMCDVLCQGTGNRFAQLCGRTITPEILEDNSMGLVVDSFSQRCAKTAGTVVIIETIDTKYNQFLGNPADEQQQSIEGNTI